MPAELPVVTPPFAPDGDFDEATVAGVLLAAGSSSRFGRPDKLLAEFEGRPLVSHAAETLLDAAVDDVLAVVRENSRVREVLPETGIDVVTNPEAARGRSTSIRRGVDAVRSRADAVVFALADMPLVDASSVDRLLAAHRADVGTALAAGYERERGNPVLFYAVHFDALRDLEGDAGGRTVLLEASDAAIVETGDPGVRVDVDTPGDLDGLDAE